MRKAIFLDRDGTIIDNQGDLGDPDQVVLLDGVAQATANLAEAGWLLLVATNQAGVARGAFTEEDIAKVHQRVDELIYEESGGNHIEHYYYCCWHPEGKIPRWSGAHECRKPSPGMLLAAKDDFDIDMSASWMIGDTVRDVQAGIAAGCQTIWLTDQDRVTGEVTPTLFAPCLLDASMFILAHEEVD